MSNKKIPEDFFENLPDRIIDRIDKEAYSQELLTHSKILASLPKDNPYCVPQGYFERLANKKIVNPRVLKMWTGVISVAATLLIMVFMTIGYEAESDVTAISNEDILSYYEENAQEVEAYMLSELLVMNEEEVLIDDYILEEIIDDLSDEELDLLNQTL